jgi:hypothetical protein
MAPSSLTIPVEMAEERAGALSRTLLLPLCGPAVSLGPGIPRVRLSGDRCRRQRPPDRVWHRSLVCRVTQAPGVRLPGSP